MAAKRDYYEVLGVNRNTSQDDIKKAFRRLARQYHPDVNKDPGAEERFKEINEAYEVLSNDQKRATYDRFGHAAVSGTGGYGGFGGFDDIGISDIFEEFFGGFGGGTRRRSAPQRGRDLEYRLTVAFEEAIFGVERDIEIERTETCAACGGSGAEPGTKPMRCTTCDGAGEVRRVQQTLLGRMVSIVTCPDCQGSGEMVGTPCRECGGNRRVRRRRRLTVSIPAGVDHGTRIRITGEGEPGVRGGPPGNLYIVLAVRPHTYFRRRGDDILLEVRINVAQAALGHVLSIPVLTPQGEATIELTIPPGTQSGDVLTLERQGVPHLRRDGTYTGYGDMQVITHVEIPKRLSDEQAALFSQLAETLGEAVIPPAAEKGFFDRMLDWLSGE